MKGQDMGKPALTTNGATAQTPSDASMVIRRMRDDVVQDLGAEADRIAEMLRAAEPPEAMQAAPVAPARGPMRLVENVELLPGGLQRRAGAHWVGMDALSVICRQAFARHQASGSNAAFVAPFTPGQIAVARDYQALVEWRDGSPIKCASLEAGRAGGGGSGLFIDSYIDQGFWLEQLRRRIGNGQAMVLRRIRPSKRGSRAAISDRVLVDQVILRDASISAVLVAHGWAKSSDHIEAARVALAAALDRMQGYRKGSC